MKDTKRREWVKSAAIVFLAVMLVLTLFSNTLMNYSLPEVSTQMMTSGRLNIQVRGTAVVQGNDPYLVVLEESRTVVSVAVQEGQTVASGEVLMVLEAVESGELKAAREQLDTLVRAYQKRIISEDLFQEAAMVENGTAGTFEENQASLMAVKAELEAAEAAGDSAGVERLREDYSDLLWSILNRMELEEQYQKINQQRELVAALEGQAGQVEITAPIGGTMAAVNYRAGQTIPAGETVAVIQRPGNETTMRMTVTAKQGSMLQVGAAAEIVSKWRYPDVEAVISGIYTNAENHDQKIIEFAVTGEVLDGEAIDLTVSVSGGEYDLLVPNSAIRQDNNGTFVLVIQAKQSPLGTRYTATRLDVEVLASDDHTSAISALADTGGFVITTSSKPLEAGQLVRLAN